jgi:hypothetical protein
VVINKNQPHFVQFGTWILLQLIEKNLDPFMANEVVNVLKDNADKQLV